MFWALAIHAQLYVGPYVSVSLIFVMTVREGVRGLFQAPPGHLLPGFTQSKKELIV